MKRIRSLLIVDDNPDDCYLATHVLNKTGGIDHIWSINEPEQVLACYADYAGSVERLDGKFPPAVVVLDINMPGMTGFELADELANREYLEGEVRPVVICMVSSSLHDADIERAEKHPLVKKYYAKPLTAAKAGELVQAFGVEVD